MRRQATGFTLIELLIVVAIIGILAAIAVPNFMNAQMRARIARVQGDLQAFSTALEQYRLDHNFYPPVSNCGAAPPSRFSGGWALIPLTTPIAYMTSLRSDPFNEDGEALTPGGSQLHPWGLYWYMDRRTRSWGSCGKAGGDRFFFNEAHLWSMKSVGPDGKENVDPRVGDGRMGFVWLLYDVSNGLFSDGDIYRFGP